MRRDVFQAIADPTRREIIGMVAHQSLNLNAVADQFNISRPAISKHIKILTECGLITIKQKGRERYCEAKFEKLNEVSNWVEQYKKFWEQKFDALEIYLKELQSNKQNNPPSPLFKGESNTATKKRNASKGKKKKSITKKSSNK